MRFSYTLNSEGRQAGSVLSPAPGAIVLTFLAGAELDPQIFRTKWKEATVVGLVGFFGPFFGCTAVAHYILHWSGRSTWLVGVALSTTSVAVVYAVMLELGFNVTDFGKAVLAACFINDLGTVIALGMIFSPFTIKTLIFVVVSVVTTNEDRRCRSTKGCVIKKEES